MNWFSDCAGMLAIAGLLVQAVPAQAQVTAHVHPHQPARAASVQVQPFDESSWAQLLQHGPRPSAYLFTTSYCSTCPEAFAVLHQAVQGSRRKVDLAAVMMDVEGVQALRHARHFKGLTRLYAFTGFEPAIRESVDPGWPNVTPYVVLVDRQGQVQKTLGAPSTALLKRWLL